jgi:DNA primase
MTGGGLAKGVDLAAVFRRYGVELVKRGGRLFALCPVHAENTPSCEVNPQKGLWHCFGCGEGGDAIDLVMKRERLTFAEALVVLGIDGQGARPGAYSARNTTPAPAASSTAATDPPEDEEDRKAIDAARRLYYGRCSALAMTPAAWYCEARGIPAMLAAASGTRDAESYMGKCPAVVFPVTGPDSHLTAIQGRFLFPPAPGEDRPDKMTRGRLRGVFSTVGALTHDVVIVTEAPIDSLSLAACGFPSLALLGTHFPTWLPGAIGARRVYLATDNDGAGDGAAQKLCDALAANGGPVYRLKPEGVKDWNAYLCTFGPVAMEEAITAAAFPGRPPCVPRPVVDLARELCAGAAVTLPGGSPATVRAYVPPEEDFPAGLVRFVDASGMPGEIDARYLCDGAGRPLVPYPLRTWREKITRARGQLTGG